MKPAPRSPAAASLQPLVDVFNRLGALGSWDGVGRKGDVSRGLDSQLKKIVLTLGGSTAHFPNTPKEGRDRGLKDLYTCNTQEPPHRSRAPSEIELTRRKTQDSCRVSLSSSTPQDKQVAGGEGGPPRGAFTLDDLCRRSARLQDLFHKTDNQSPITVRKITIGGDVKVKGVWTSQKEFTDCPVDMRLKTRTPVEFLRFPEKDECDEEPLVVEERRNGGRPRPTPEGPAERFGARVIAVPPRLRSSGGLGLAPRWRPSGRSLASVGASTGAPISKPLQLNETCTARCHTEAITLVLQ